jgi:acetyl-CoA hydrolase
MPMSHGFPELTPDEAAAMIFDGAMIGFSGFTPAGAAKAVPRALAARARRLHDEGQPMKVRVLTGASTGTALDDALADADAISWRAPYQSSRALRRRINEQQVEFVDMHLSHLPQMIEFGFFGNLDFAVVEAVDVMKDGRVYLSTSVGASPTFLRHADRVIIEINSRHSQRLMDMHDVRLLPPPPHRSHIPIDNPLHKIGAPFAHVNPAKIVGVIETDEPDGVAAFDGARFRRRGFGEELAGVLELRKDCVRAL